MKFAAPLAGLIALAFAAQAPAQTPAPAGPAAPPLLNSRPELKAPMSLGLMSNVITDGKPIPLDNSSYGASRSPDLMVMKAPPAAKSFVYLMEDPDSQRGGLPILHWIAYNAPAMLPAGLPAGAALTDPVAIMQAPNVAGQNAYRGPHPGPGAVHHYHLEAFALDTTLPPGLADRDALAKAMAGHVLAQGEMVGTFEAPAPAAKP
jgi:Raf kinase inhibitor-like YbhB/YbcL family protein